MAGLSVKVLLANRRYDVNWLVDAAHARRVKVVIPPKVEAEGGTDYDKELYKERHLIEHVFRWLKQCRGIATRSAQRSDSFFAALYLRSIFLPFDVLTTPPRK
jgi:transposase